MLGDQQKPGVENVTDDFLLDILGSGVDSVTVESSGADASVQLTNLQTILQGGTATTHVIAIDVVWTAPFADNGWIIELDSYLDPNELDDYGVGIQPAQKPESFHHFILENKYQDLEKSIRGYKDVYNKNTREWETKRKETHCFTDEEAEEILRTAQSLLATDIKLSFINKRQ